MPGTETKTGIAQSSALEEIAVVDGTAILIADGTPRDPAEPAMDPIDLVHYRTIGNYVVGQVLGCGTFGEVRLGRNQATGDYVAVKIVDRAHTDGRCATNEISILRLLNHEHIAKLLDVVHDAPLSATFCRYCACTEYYPARLTGECRTCSPHHFRDHCRVEEERAVTMIVQEIGAGGDLFASIRERGPFPEQIARLYFTQMCQAVLYCHQNGVVHRDLRPENMVLDRDHNLKIIDFGIAAVLTDGRPPDPVLVKTKENDFCPTLYAAPELFDRRRHVVHGQPTDVWSAAVVLFIMLSGRPPFRRPLHRTVDDNHRRCEHFRSLQAGNYPSCISAQARDLLASMFAVDPTARPDMQAVLGHAWVADGPVPTAKQLSTYMTARRQSPKTPRDADLAGHEDEKVSHIPTPAAPAGADNDSERIRPES
ncbi:Protein kinase domain-containing protein [Plasmodiophora brassicae]|nr:hypothetical protein PBRA_003087 [Plasmodiophora brassicae]